MQAATARPGKFLKTMIYAMGLAIAIPSVGAYAAQSGHITKQSVSAECTTKGTSWDGSRNSCDSSPSVLTAPAGHVFAEKSLTGGMVSANGSEKSCSVQFSDYVEVIPGIPQPTKLTLKAHARSPRHHHGARGWANCTYGVSLVRYAAS